MARVTGFEHVCRSVLGAKPIDAFHWESFGKGWVGDILKELKLEDSTIVHEGGYGTRNYISLSRSTI